MPTTSPSTPTNWMDLLHPNQVTSKVSTSTGTPTGARHLATSSTGTHTGTQLADEPSSPQANQADDTSQLDHLQLDEENRNQWPGPIDKKSIDTGPRRSSPTNEISGSN